MKHSSGLFVPMSLGQMPEPPEYMYKVGSENELKKFSGDE
jgi:hypothetical protein